MSETTEAILVEWDETDGQWIKGYWVPFLAIELLGGMAGAIKTIELLSNARDETDA